MKKSQTKNLKELGRCSECNDTGFVITYRDGIEYARPCKCQEVNRMKKILEKSGISEEFQSITLSGYRAYSESTKTAKATAKEYLSNFQNIRGSRQNSICFMGQVGSGKTHLSIAIANFLMKKGIPVMYMPYRDTITALKQNIQNEEYYQGEINRYKTVDVLLIDDLCKGKVTDADLNIMFEIINYRYLKFLPMIISTEYDTDRLLSWDEAVGSRIIHMCKDYLVEIRGEENNYRLRG